MKFYSQLQKFGIFESLKYEEQRVALANVCEKTAEKNWNLKLGLQHMLQFLAIRFFLRTSDQFKVGILKERNIALIESFDFPIGVFDPWRSSDLPNYCFSWLDWEAETLSFLSKEINENMKAVFCKDKKYELGAISIDSSNVCSGALSAGPTGSIFVNVSYYEGDK